MVAAEVIEIAQKKGIPIETNYARDHLDVIRPFRRATSPPRCRTFWPGAKRRSISLLVRSSALARNMASPTPYNEFLYHAIRVLEAKNAGTVEEYNIK